MQLVACPLIGIGCTPECTGFVCRMDLETHIAKPTNLMVFAQQVVTRLQQQEREIEDLKISIHDLAQAHHEQSARQEARMVQLEELISELQLQRNSFGSSSRSSSQSDN
jgi:hypothetical protein